MTKAALFGLAAILLLLGHAPISHAYVPSTTTTSGKALRWTESNCVMLRAHSAGSDDISDGEALAAIERSVKRWHDAVGHCSYMRFDLLTPSPDVTIEFIKSGINENAILWVEDGWQKELKHDPQAAGLTTVFFVDSPDSPRDGKILDADMELNGEFFVFSAATAGVKGHTDVENTVVHELGHVLGLDHPCDDGLRKPVPKDHTGTTIPACSLRLPAAIRDSTMFNFADTGETKKRTPGDDDVLGICETYPSKDDPGVCAAPTSGTEPGCQIQAEDSAPSAPFTIGLALLVAFVATRRWRSLRRNAQDVR